MQVIPKSHRVSAFDILVNAKTCLVLDLTLSFYALPDAPGDGGAGSSGNAGDGGQQGADGEGGPQPAGNATNRLSLV